MKSSFKKRGGSRIDIEITLEPAEFKRHYDEVRHEALSRVNIKGFRPGTAPEAMAEAAINQDKVFEEAVQDAVRFSLNQATEENGWVVVDQPRVEVLEAADVLKNGGLKFKAELIVFPEVKIADYKKIAREINAGKKAAEVTPDEIEKTLMWVRKSRAPMVRVTRAAVKGDVLDIDITTAHEGKPVPGGDIKNDKFELGEGKFVPGFEEKVTGHKEGEEIDFTITAPANYWQKEFAGKKLDFKVEIHTVFELTIPEANDEFAKSLGKFNTIEDVKKNISEGMILEKEQKESEKRHIKMLDKIVTDSKMDLPEIFVTKTLDGMLEELRQTIEQAGEKADEARKSLHGAAEKRVAANVAVHELAKLEGLEPKKEEVEEESKYHTHKSKGVDADKFYDYIYGILLNRKVFEFLESIK